MDKSTIKLFLLYLQLNRTNEIYIQILYYFLCNLVQEKLFGLR